MPGEEKPKKKKKVIYVKKIFRKKKNHGGNDECDKRAEALEPTSAYVSPAAEAGDVPEDDGTGPTLQQSMDQHAQASAEADAALLSQEPKTLQPEKATDTLEDTQVDADPGSDVIDVDSQPSKLESELGDLMNNYFEDRQKLPEEETQPYEVNETDGEHGDGDTKKAAALGDNNGTYVVPVQAESTGDKKDVAESADASPPPNGDAAVYDEKNDWSTSWNDTWSGGYWPNYGWGSNGSWHWGGYPYYGHGWNYDMTYWKNNDDSQEVQPHETFVRSSSVDSGFSGMTGLTSVSKLDRSLNRLNTPDLDKHVGKSHDLKEMKHDVPQDAQKTW